MRMFTAALAVATAAVAGILTPSAALADDPTSPSGAVGTITSPQNGSTFAAGDQITFTVDGLTDWYVDIWCENTDQDYYTDRATDDDPQVVATNDTSSHYSCSADLFDAEGGWHDSMGYGITGTLMSNEIRNLTIRPTKFFPHVRDGYRDRIDIAFGVRANADVTMTVVNPDGRVVRTNVIQHAGDTDTSYYRNWVGWNGRKDNGELAPEGRYRVVVVSEGDGLQTASASSAVQVASGWRIVERTKRPDPWWDSIDEKRGNCFIRRSSYPHGNELDCWGGAYAQATYRVRVPADARITGWFAGGQRGCCDIGRVIKTGKRVSPGVFQVRVRVTDWSAFTVTRVGVSYWYRKRI